MNQAIIFKKIILIMCLAFSISTYATPNTPILDYHSIFIPGYDADGNYEIAIRMYYKENTPYFLVVNSVTLQTKVIQAADFRARSKSKDTQVTPKYYTMDSLKKTPYLTALSKYSSPPYLLTNQGLTHAQGAVNGMFLTIDMCPSSKPFEKAFFEKLVSLSNDKKQPIPIALAMSGLWMIIHPQEFDWLIEQEKNKKLAITWVNHSFSHIYYRDLPIEKNFMLVRPGDFTHEILETEKILLQKGLLPSVFFRYPGLVSNEVLSLKLAELGLIPLGADAWLAKGEIAKSGSIILVHGNSNEHQGIEKIMLMLEEKNLHLLPLSGLLRME